MNALTGSRKFNHFDRIIEEEGNRTMITVLDRREKRGEKRGEEKLGLLISRLAEQGRMEDIVKVSKDRKYREELYRKFNIASADEEIFEKS